MTDEEPKSAWELAMERFRRQDAEKGAVEQSLTQQQKAAIEECRRAHTAKVAELEIMYQSKMKATQDPEKRQIVESSYRRDLDRAAEDRDRAIAKIRSGK